MPLEINPPDTIYENNFAGFVEGITWTINQYEVFLTLYLTEYALSVLEGEISPAIEYSFEQYAKDVCYFFVFLTSIF